MKIIIAGSRGLSPTPAEIDQAVADSGFVITEVVSGGARDRHGELWAGRHNLPIKRFFPDWVGDGRKAGILRNCRMGDYADGLIAFWDGSSPGTNHMVGYMEKLGKPVSMAGVPF